MKHVLFVENAQNKYSTAILIKTTSLKQKELTHHYYDPLVSKGVTDDSIIAFSLKYSDKGTSPIKLINGYLANLLPVLDSLGVKTLLVADSAYFKKLSGQRTSEPHHGYIMPCAVKGFEHMDVVLTVNYQGLFYNPDLQTKVDMSLNTLADHTAGTHIELGSDIIHYEYYPNAKNEYHNAAFDSINQVLNSLHRYPVLACDTETFSLRFDKAGIGTIGFAWDQHNGIAFPIDYVPNKHPPIDDFYGHQEDNQTMKGFLRTFFEAYQGKLIWHNANFDLKILIFELWMDNFLDIKGLIKGLEVMTRLIDDTKIIAYLATNSTAGNDLKLKNLAHEFAGNYAQDDINDIRRIPLPDLLRYNLTDCLSTWYVHNTYYPVMIQDNQQTVYDEVLIPSIKVILQMELHGMPMDMAEVAKARKFLEAIQSKAASAIFASPIIKEFTTILRKEECLKANLLLKKKVKPLEEFNDVVFNPGSNPNLQRLLYAHLGFTIQDTTKKGQPATGNKVVKKLMFQLINEHGITEEELL